MMLGWACIAALGASYAMTAWLLRRSPIRGLIDRPNARSSHSTPTPRGGGLSMVAVTSGGLLLLCAAGKIPLPLTGALLLGGLGVAAVGFWDDVRSAPVAVRMAVHFGAAGWAVYCLGGTPVIRMGALSADLGIMGSMLSVLAIVWTLNLFNFMDGIDGIAASEAACILFGAAALGLFIANCPADAIAPELVAGAACLGFLKWNWPPARIFMGDIGSGYLGYIVAVIGVHSSQTSRINIFAWLILGGLFFVDATLTLCRRLARRERVYEAHRTHAYQWLARRWGSHARVTLSVIGVNIAWLFPCAVLAVEYPAHAAWICLISLLPLVGCALLSGAGRPE